MKAYQEETFTPIHVVLESQEEVNAIFSILNFSPVAEAFDCLGVASSLSRLRHILSEYNTPAYEEYHKMLDDTIGKI